MPGSPTTPGRPGARIHAPVRFAFRDLKRVGTRDGTSFAAQWLAYALPCRRFTCTLTDAGARLGADVDRYSFIVSDLHRLLLAGLPAHSDLVHTISAIEPQISPAARKENGIAKCHAHYPER